MDRRGLACRPACHLPPWWRKGLPLLAERADVLGHRQPLCVRGQRGNSLHLRAISALDDGGDRFVGPLGEERGVERHELGELLYHHRHRLSDGAVALLAVRVVERLAVGCLSRGDGGGGGQQQSECDYVFLHMILKCGKTKYIPPVNRQCSVPTVVWPAGK